MKNKLIKHNHSKFYYPFMRVLKGLAITMTVLLVLSIPCLIVFNVHPELLTILFP